MSRCACHMSQWMFYSLFVRVDESYLTVGQAKLGDDGNLGTSIDKATAARYLVSHKELFTARASSWDVYCWSYWPFPWFCLIWCLQGGKHFLRFCQIFSDTSRLDLTSCDLLFLFFFFLSCGFDCIQWPVSKGAVETKGLPASCAKALGSFLWTELASGARM